MNGLCLPFACISQHLCVHVFVCVCVRVHLRECMSTDVVSIVGAAGREGQEQGY